MKELIVKTSLALLIGSGVGYTMYLDEARDQAKVEQLQVENRETHESYIKYLKQSNKYQKQAINLQDSLWTTEDKVVDLEKQIVEKSKEIQRQSEEITKLQKQIDESPSVSSSGWTTFEASAYTTAANGDKYVSAKWGNKTASGTTPTQGRTIAVDRNLIPLGTKLLVKFPEPYSYLDGTYTAEDTGNGIKGHEVDLFLNSHSECINFGVRDIKIKTL